MHFQLGPAARRGCWPGAKSMSGRIRRRQIMAASRQRASRSAPTKPCVIAARWLRSTSSASGMPRLWISRISCRPLRSGMGMAISRSNRPGRRSAGSSALGMLVAAITMTFWRLASPSISASSCATTRFSTSPDDLLPPRGDGVDLVEEDDARALRGRPPRRSSAGGLRSRRRTCG